MTTEDVDKISNEKSAIDDNDEVKQQLVAVIGDQETVVGFLLAGIGEQSASEANFLITTKDTKPSEIEAFFTGFLARTDIAVILINQHDANKIRPVVNSKVSLIPAVLEIPSKTHAYDPERDPTMRKASMYRHCGETEQNPIDILLSSSQDSDKFD